MNDTATTTERGAESTAVSVAPAPPIPPEAAATSLSRRGAFIGAVLVGAAAVASLTLAIHSQQRVKSLEQELVKRQQDSQGQVIEARAAAKQAQDISHAAEAKVALLEARGFTEEVDQLDLRGAYRNRDDAEGRKLVATRLAAGASFLRDLVYTAWIESAKPLPPVKPVDLPNSPENPRYNPATGSAPAPAKP